MASFELGKEINKDVFFVLFQAFVREPRMRYMSVNS